MGVLGRGAGIEGEFHATTHRCKRSAQLVGDVCGETALVATGGGDPLEQMVERRCKTRDLVARRTERKAPVEIVLAPVLGIRRHPPDRVKRAVQSAPDRDRTAEQNEQPDRQRTDQHLALEVVERRGRDLDDDRADNAIRAARMQRDGAQAHVARAVGIASRRPRAERDGNPVERRRHARRALDQPPMVEDPCVGVERLVVDGVAHTDPGRRHRQHSCASPRGPACSRLTSSTTAAGLPSAPPV